MTPDEHEVESAATLHMYMQRLCGLAELGHRALAGMPANTLSALAAELAYRTSSAESVSVTEVRPDGRTLVLQAAAGPGPRLEAVRDTELSENAAAVLTGGVVIVDNLATDVRFTTKDDLAVAGLVSLVSVPIENGGVLGLVSAASCKRAAFTPDDAVYLESIAHILGEAMNRELSDADLRQSEREFNALFEESLAGMSIADTRGRLIRVNPAFASMLGLSPAELLGRSFWELMHPGDMPAAWATWEELLKGRLDALRVESRYLGREGAPVNAVQSIVLVRDESGRPAYVQTTVLDVTDATRASWALDRKPARGASDVAAGRRHQLALITDVLDLAKVEAGQMRFQSEPLEVAPLVEETLTAVRPLADAKALRLDASIEEVSAMGDRRRLVQVLLNLLSNAVKYTDTGGIHIEARRAGTEALISVADTGAGISLEDQKLLFQDFVQLDKARVHTLEGPSLGLALARRFVEGMGGKLTLESRPGAGAEFTVTLPAVPSEKPGTASRSSRAGA